MDNKEYKRLRRIGKNKYLSDKNIIHLERVFSSKENRESLNRRYNRLKNKKKLYLKRLCFSTSIIRKKRFQEALNLINNQIRDIRTINLSIAIPLINTKSVCLLGIN